MRDNAIKFENYINEHKIYMNKGLNLDDFTIFTFPEKITVDGVTKPVLGGGQERRAVIALRDDDTLADIFCFHITSVPNNLDKAKLYALFNDLNSTYKYISFYEDTNVISAKISIPFNDNFDSDLVFQMLAIIFRAIDEEYPKILSTLHN
ncbi:MAG: YbjN domain-containing protein [Clostridium sp.]|uniref:YbjN domain-containing protein n=1 Tax=Clostridium sp. TaxID=1506 RepID=UPI00305A1EE1